MHFLVYCLSALFALTSSKDCGRIGDNQDDTMPWIINIYQSKGAGQPKLTCSGTLISERIILTATSCFYDDTSKQFRKEKFYLTIGDRYKNWTLQDNSVQTREISESDIIKSHKYGGFSGHYKHNIAIVKLNENKKIKLNEPACVYWDNEFTDAFYEDNSPTLNMVVWKKGIETSIILQGQHIDYDECKYLLKAKNVAKFLTYDKFCLKLNDLTVIPSVGSGVYVFNEAKKVWYLIGITSEITSADTCIYITYAKLNTHLNWISNSVYLLL